MAEISENELKTEIAKILKVADLATTSTIKVRQMLEKKFDTDFTERKGLIKQLVMDYIDNQPSESEEESDAKEEEEEEEVVEVKKPPPKKRPATRKRKGSDADSDGEWKTKKVAKKGGGGGGRGKNSGYTRALRLSPALAELVGAPQMPRHEVVRRVWALIKERNLYDPSNRQYAICDDSLYKVFQTKRIRTFGMMKYLKTHFLD